MKKKSLGVILVTFLTAAVFFVGSTSAIAEALRFESLAIPIVTPAPVHVVPL